MSREKNIPLEKSNFVHTAKDIGDLCRPLKEWNITHFFYSNLYDDDTVSFLT